MSQKSPNVTIPRPTLLDEDDTPFPPEIEELREADRRRNYDLARMREKAAEHGEPSAPHAPAPAVVAPRPTMSKAMQERAGRDREELESMDPEAGADERILLRLVGDTLPTVLVLNELTEHLAINLPGLIDNPAVMKLVATAMHDSISHRNATLRSLQSVVATVASLRAQRRFIQRHGGQNGV